ncbi:MAG: transglutaminase-like protein, partial [Chloroflexi bacterium]|nr:transglutaminase-like protein [Chloroflexota bacterium]
MRLGVKHSTRITYSSPVSEEVLETRLGPYSDNDQRWERFDLRVRPRGLLRPFDDAFGNSVYLITLVGPHDFIEVVTEGAITTSAGDPYALPREPVRPLT